MHPDWARSLRDQCAEADVPFFFKQWGEYGPYNGEGGVDGAWLDLDGHYYGGPNQWPPTADESRAYMIRWGKKAAGRLLDGIEHNGMPA
jgi:protein gp37